MEATRQDDVRRVLIAGDSHGNTGWVAQLAQTAVAHGCDLILQVGDFGYFPAHAEGSRFLTAVDAACDVLGVDLWFIDGNHDDHESLASIRHAPEPVALTDRVSYLSRGLRVDLGGVSFGFLGGAFSVDWRQRTNGIDWWPDEVTEVDDVERLGDRPLDVLVTHDAPAGIELASWQLPGSDQIRADEVRFLIKRAVEATTPRVAIHGHWHHGYESELGWIDRSESDRTGELVWRSTRAVGLGCDGDAQSGWFVLDLPSLEITWPPLVATGSDD